MIGRSSRLRSATWSTARSSVTVDLFAGEHGVALGLDPGLPGQLEQQGHGRFRDPILGIVEEDVAQTQGKTIEPAGIGREQIAHVQIPDLPVMLGQRRIRRQFRQQGHTVLLSHEARGCPWTL